MEISDNMSDKREINGADGDSEAEDGTGASGEPFQKPIRLRKGRSTVDAVRQALNTRMIGGLCGRDHRSGYPERIQHGGLE